jgi:hypothetical protein
MTILEACKELREQVKPYQGLMHHGTYANTLRAIEDGRAKPKTISDFFEKFGYKVSFNAEVTKICGTPEKNK